MKFVATFIGETNLFEGMVSADTPDGFEISLESGTIRSDAKGFHFGELVARIGYVRSVCNLRSSHETVFRSWVKFASRCMWAQ